MTENNSPKYHIREARIEDAHSILDLIADEVRAGRMLPRKLDEVQSLIGDWRVAVIDETIVGAASLEFFNDELCELRSLAVVPEYRGNGLGSALISSTLDLARERDMARVLTLTRSTRLFEQVGFQQDFVLNFPEKVWRDCNPCPFRHQCDEVALIHYLNKTEKS